jgi:hypothetical protein
MATRQPHEYFRRHSALADWLKPVRPKDRDAIIEEDSTRSARLELLNDLIGLPILRTITFSGREVTERSKRFESFRRCASGAYALRAFRLEGRNDVLRNRNLPVDELMSWLESRIDDVRDYELEFSPHLPNLRFNPVGVPT